MNAKAQRGRPPKKSRCMILLERDFCDYFDKSRSGAMKTIVHLFGWIARDVEKAKDADERRERLIRDFAASPCNGPRTWRKAVEWYCSGKIGGGE